MKKSTKSKGSAVVSPADQDVVGLITTLVQRLVSLEAKMDTLLSRTSQRPAEAPRQQPMPGPSTQQRRDVRTMYKVICADCRKECEVPFRPAGDRPVYCKECYAKRKSSGTFKPRQEGRPKEGQMPVLAQVPEKSAAAEHAKPARKKKPAAKKKKK